MRIIVSVAAFCLAVTSPALAQDPEGVRLGLRYEPEYQPGLVVLPFSSTGGARQLSAETEAIIIRDLDYSDRFELRDGRDAGDGPPDLSLWKERGADWVLQGEVTGSDMTGASLRLVLHDAVYGRVRADETFRLPVAGDPEFRMAVHAAADAVVFWATGDPGAAATRIAFVREGRNAKEIYLVDWDGENVQRLTDDGSIALSPAWSPDGQRIAYTSYRTGNPFLYERELATGSDRLLSDRDGINITPAYAPNGSLIAFATTVAGSTEIATYDREQRCCLQQQTRGRFSDSLSPSFSPDGRQFAFMSSRLGEPHIYVMSLGGQARLISDYAYGGRAYNTSPDWSPRGSVIAYQGRIDGVHQILIADLDRNVKRLLTNEGTNEDPSWAPDGRHLVFASRDREGGGIFVLDTVSGRVRPLLRGAGYGLPDWSPTLRSAVDVR